MNSSVLSLREVDKTQVSIVGGKAVNLGELFRLEGIRVPEGFCVTTEAYRKSIEENAALNARLDRLAGLSADDREQIGALSGEIRDLIEAIHLDEGIVAEITGALSAFDVGQCYAVRSSATAEDLPTASFAGQQDTYLNVQGRDAVLRCVVKCWASLFTERAVTYRIRNGFDHRKVRLAVIVQKMIPAEVSGILFTADPLSSDRKTLSIDAGFGLGEAFVSGLVNPDIYKVRDGAIVSRQTGRQRQEIRPAAGGGTQTVSLAGDGQGRPALSDPQVLELAAIGRRIEAHFGCPQDIEWCWFDGTFYLVQSRPITTLFPPPPSPDGAPHVYLSAGHMQMMTDPILPLGMSIFTLAALFPVDQAGGRLYVDITHDLATPVGRRVVKQRADNMDPLMSSAVNKLIARPAFLKRLPRGKGNLAGAMNWLPWLLQAIRIYRKNDPALLEAMVRRTTADLTRLEQHLAGLSGVAVIDGILQDRTALQAALYDSTAFGAVLVCQYVSGWLDRNLEKWLGEKNLTHVFSKSVEHNITSRMGLELAGVADVVRRYPAVLEYLGRADDAHFFEDLQRLEGGAETAAALRNFLERYGMRCTGEIDITRPRWSEKPTELIRMILSDVAILAPGEYLKRFEQGRREAEDKENEILRRLAQRPGGAAKARKAQKLIHIFRNFVGAREYPKYFWVWRYAIYKRALLKEADRLVAEGVLNQRDDAFYLYLEEFREAIRTRRVDKAMIEQRRRDYEHYARLTPPRIILSDGEVPAGEYTRAGLPQGALVGIAVSPGVVEGRARVIEKLEDAHVESGDILITTFTDPSWTPLFVSIAGLVTEVGGMMSHGAVITREYGLPAVVGVENATQLIRDGQRIRLNGTDGFIELL